MKLILDAFSQKKTVTILIIEGFCLIASCLLAVLALH